MVKETRPAVVAAKINWCSGADDWGDSDIVYAPPTSAGGACAGTEAVDEDADNANDESNGNVIGKMDNRYTNLLALM